MKLEEFNLLKEECIKLNQLVPEITSQEYETNKNAYLLNGFVIKNRRSTLCSHIDTESIISSIKPNSKVRCRISDEDDPTEFKFHDLTAKEFLKQFYNDGKISALDNIYTSHFKNGLTFIDDKLYFTSFNQFIELPDLLQQYKQVLYVHAGCYTTLHMDPAETSLQIALRGEKDFLFINPNCTIINSSKDFYIRKLIKYTIYLHLEADDVFVIPASVAHAAYTHESSITLTQDFTSINTIRKADIAAVKNYKKYSLRLVSQKIYFSLKVIGLLNIKSLLNSNEAELWNDLFKSIIYQCKKQPEIVQRNLDEYFSEIVESIRKQIILCMLKVLPDNNLTNIQITINNKDYNLDRNAVGRCFAYRKKNKSYWCLLCDNHGSLSSHFRSKNDVADHIHKQSYVF